MATANDLYDDAVTALNTAIGAGTHASSDWLVNIAFPSGVTSQYQVVVDPLATAEGSNSNEANRVAAVRVTLAQKVGTAESAGEQDTFRSTIEALLVPSFWRGLASVYRVAEGPELQGDSVRVGNILRAVVAVEIDLTP